MMIEQDFETQRRGQYSRRYGPSYDAWRTAQDQWQHHVDTGEGDGPALSAAAKTAEAEFIRVHGNAS